MNFRRGSPFFLISSVLEDTECCFQKTHKLIHNLASGVGALSMESDGQSLLLFPKGETSVYVSVVPQTALIIPSRASPFLVL